MDTLESLREEKRLLETARRQLLEENVKSVSIEGRALTRHGLMELREELNIVNRKIKQLQLRERGDDPLFGDKIKVRLPLATHSRERYLGIR